MDIRQALIYVVLAVSSLSFILGFYLGSTRSWSYVDVATVERRMREVFCEQALRNNLMKHCDPNFVRKYDL